MPVSFDLFGTLVDVSRPADPAAAVADALAERGVPVPDDWDDRYARSHVDAPDGAEVPLPAHVAAVLSSAGVEYEGNAVRRAVVSAFDPVVETLEGAPEAVAAARAGGPVAICSNCSVPGLASRTLVRSALERDAFDAVVTSAGCGWRKPAPGIFEATAAHLGVAAADLVHVGDDPATDGGIEAVGGTYCSLEDASLADVAAELEATR